MTEDGQKTTDDSSKKTDDTAAKKDTAKTEKAAGADTNTAKTGDTAYPTLWVLVMFFALAAGLAAAGAGKRADRY